MGIKARRGYRARSRAAGPRGYPAPRLLDHASASLLVRYVLTAPATVLLQLQALPGVGLALRRHVVPPLALLARKSDRRSFVTSHRYSVIRTP